MHNFHWKWSHEYWLFFHILHLYAWWSSYSKIKSPAKKTTKLNARYQFLSLKISKKIFFNFVNKFVCVIFSRTISHFKPTKTSLFVVTIFLRYPTINDIHTQFQWCIFDVVPETCYFDFSLQYLKSGKNLNVSYNQYMWYYEMTSKTLDDNHLLVSSKISKTWNALFQSMYCFVCFRLSEFIFWVFDLQFCKSSELLPDFHHRDNMLNDCEFQSKNIMCRKHIFQIHQFPNSQLIKSPCQFWHMEEMIQHINSYSHDEKRIFHNLFELTCVVVWSQMGRQHSVDYPYVNFYKYHHKCLCHHPIVYFWFFFNASW